jgi:hypothetical protein
MSCGISPRPQLIVALLALQHTLSASTHNRHNGFKNFP